MSGNVIRFLILLSLCNTRFEVIDLMQAIAVDQNFNQSDFTICYSKAISLISSL